MIWVIWSGTRSAGLRGCIRLSAGDAEDLLAVRIKFWSSSEVRWRFIRKPFVPLSFKSFWLGPAGEKEPFTSLRSRLDSMCLNRLLAGLTGFSIVLWFLVLKSWLARFDGLDTIPVRCMRGVYSVKPFFEQWFLPPLLGILLRIWFGTQLID